MKPRYRINLDSSTTLLLCPRSHFEALRADREAFIADRQTTQASPGTEMHPEQIKAEIRMKGTNPAAIADALGLSRMTVSNVIHGRITSRRVAEAISSVIKKPVEGLWPGRYDPKRRSMMKRSGA